MHSNKTNSGKTLSRRSFIKAGALTVGAISLSNNWIQAEEATTSKKIRTAFDQVSLGNTGLKLSRLGFGCGTNSGSIQRKMGHEEFNKVIRYAYDRGITYFDSAESYETHTWLKEALKGIPREKLFIQTKIPGWGIKNADEAFARIERYLKELGTDYIDSLLIHCQTKKNWPELMKPTMEGLQKAKDKKMIRVHGISSHSLPATRAAIACDWCQTMLIRLNPQGHITDTEEEVWNSPDGPKCIPEVVNQIKKASTKGKGLIAMKLVGNGDFTNADDREKAMRFAMGVRELNAAVIGFKSISEVDESIERMNNALKDIDNA